MGVAVEKVKIHTTKGCVQFDVWDIAGTEKCCPSLLPYYYYGADYAVVMFSENNHLSYVNTKRWHESIKKIGDIPMLLIGLKSDLAKIGFGPNANSDLKGYLTYYSLSAKAGYHKDKPFLGLVQHLLGDDTKIIDGDE